MGAFLISGGKIMSERGSIEMNNGIYFLFLFILSFLSLVCLYYGNYDIKIGGKRIAVNRHPNGTLLEWEARAWLTCWV